ncbi:MAG: glycosyltransferase family 39 protein [Candidatus Buchananbacteria bacterium]|nr:glycosyltransferase family 39 protein [Candidatus Buchananbacteria bacterium]
MSRLANIKINLIVLAVILLLAGFLRGYGLTSHDLLTDDSLYSFRALGYFDYLAAGGQTTPIQWFGHIPWWANLSFHDAPPLVFIIQKIFFLIFGDNTLAARLPFFFAGLVSVAIMYFIFLELFKKKWPSFLGATFFSFLASNIWVSQVGYLEGFAIVFISLSLLFFIKFINSDKNSWLMWCGAAIGLALITKYTTLFLIPTYLFYLVFFKREIFKQSRFYLSILISFIVFLPVGFYNLMVYQTRGHFDAAISSMVGMHPQDFSTISGRSISINYWSNFSAIFKTLASLVSWPIMALFVLSLIYAVWCLTSRRNTNYFFLFFIGLIFLILEFIFIGASNRFLPIFNSFLVGIICLAFFDCWSLFASHKIKSFILLTLVGLMLGWELFYGINFLAQGGINKNRFFYSVGLSEKSLGFNRLTDYFDKNILTEDDRLVRPKKLSDVSDRAGEYIKEKRTIFLVDGSISWFAYMWYELKYPIYYGLPFVFIDQQQFFTQQDFIQYLDNFEKIGAENFYYIFAQDSSLVDSVKINNGSRENNQAVASYLNNFSVSFDEIKNDRGFVAFRIYQFNLKTIN